MMITFSKIRGLIHILLLGD